VTAGGFVDRLLPRLETLSISLTVEEIRLLGEYWSLLARWNPRVNLTALPLDGYPLESVDRLIVEPLVAVRTMAPGSPTWFDLGSGGGSPAIPLKIACPAAALVMVESRSRKAAFLREVVRSLGLGTAEAVNDRFENVAERHERAADCITVRAVRPDEDMLTTVRRLLKPSGRMIRFENPASMRDLPGFSVMDEIAAETLKTRIRILVPRGTND
jgi:16S rRNA (guanine527-N7)-methyltransferase